VQEQKLLKRFCPTCEKGSVFGQAVVNHRLHIVLCFLTLGAWLIPYAIFAIGKKLLPWTCLNCGFRKPEPTKSYRRAWDESEAESPALSEEFRSSSPRQAGLNEEAGR
jgi:hypothetical protein